MTSRRKRQRSPELSGGGVESEFMPAILPGNTIRVTNARAILPRSRSPGVLVRLDHVAGVIVNVDHSIMR